MKTLALHLQKGGVGKTSLTGAIAYELANKGKVIMLDGDPQANLSSWFVTDSHNPKYELADILQGKCTLEEAIINCGSVDIIPSFGLDGTLKLYAETKLADEPFIFCDLIDEIKKIGYEYVVCDLSPGIGRLEKSVLLACDEVITPLMPEYFSVDGLEIFTHELKKLEKNFRKSPTHKRIFLNAYDARIKMHLNILEASKKLAYEVYVIPVDQGFRKAQSNHISPQLAGLKKETLDIIRELISEI